MSFVLNHPHRHAVVPNPFTVAGFGTAFEGEARVRVTDGHDEVVRKLQVGGVAAREFSRKIDLSGASFARTRLLVQAFELSAEDGSEIIHASRAVYFGPGIMSDTHPPGFAPFEGYQLRRVVSGDTLFEIAADAYGDGSKFPRIVAANAHKIPDPDLIFPGQVLRIPF